MLIHTPKEWQLPESLVTPEAASRTRTKPVSLASELPQRGADCERRPRNEAPSRRQFVQTLGLAVASAALLPSRSAAATGGFPSRPNPAYADSGLKPTAYDLITSYNNFYEFGTGKDDPKPNARDWKTEPWTVEISGHCRNPVKIDVNDLIAKLGGIEQRVYRFRCVEAWSMVIPWDGFPLAKLVQFADPTGDATHVKFTTVFDPTNIPGQRGNTLDWPYVEGLRMDEAMNELSFIATGIYGKPIPNQNGAPLRLVVPWKYGFKGAKSLVKIEFVEKQPRNTWNIMAPQEYGFFANVNPKVDHPRWSQASERVIGAGGVFGSRQRTLMFNGYEKQVAALYKGMDLEKFY